MTLREIAINVIGLDDPITAIFGIVHLIRSIEQEEPATFEGCCASFLAFYNLYHEVTADSILQFLDDIGPLANIDINDSLIARAINCNDD